MTAETRSHGIRERHDSVMGIASHGGVDGVIAKSPLSNIEKGLPESCYASLVVRLYAAATEVVFTTAVRR